MYYERHFVTYNMPDEGEENLWEQFNLREDNPDVCGGITYAMTFPSTEIQAHRESVVKALIALGVGVIDIGEFVLMHRTPKFDEGNTHRVQMLAEELSVLNDASTYNDSGIEAPLGVGGLCDRLMGMYFECLRANRLADAFTVVASMIPEIVTDLTIGAHENKVLKEKGDSALLRDLLRFAIERTQELSVLRNGKTVVFHS